MLATEHCDEQPHEVVEQLQLAALEQRVWEVMQDIKRLAGKLFLASEKLGGLGWAGEVAVMCICVCPQCIVGTWMVGWSE